MSRNLMTNDSPPATVDANYVQRDGGMIAAKTQYLAAQRVQRPRDIKQITKSLLDEATAAGEDFFYSWGVGRNRVEGPSEQLAFTAARLWGNCAVVAEETRETPDTWEFPSTFVDLETGFTYTRSWFQSKRSEVYGDMDDHRKATIRHGQGQSKSARNVILKCLPKFLIAGAMRAAKLGVRQEVVELIKKHGKKEIVSRLFKSLAERHRVDEDRVLHKYGVPTKEALTEEHLCVIRSDLRVLDENEDFPESIYPHPTEAKQTPATSASPAGAAQQALREMEERLGGRLEERKPTKTHEPVDSEDITDGLNAQAEPPEPGTVDDSDQDRIEQDIRDGLPTLLDTAASLGDIKTIWRQAVKQCPHGQRSPLADWVRDTCSAYADRLRQEKPRPSRTTATSEMDPVDIRQSHLAMDIPAKPED